MSADLFLLEVGDFSDLVKNSGQSSEVNVKIVSNRQLHQVEHHLQLKMSVSYLWKILQVNLTYNLKISGKDVNIRTVSSEESQNYK